MTPRDYLDVARERWRFIVAGLLLGLVLAGAVTYLVPRQYAATATVIVATQPTGDAVRTSNDEEISSQRISTYAELLGSRRLAADVVAQLRLPTTPEELATRITVGTTPDSVLLTATVVDASADEAIRIVNTVADQFIVNVAEIEQPADRLRTPLVAAKVFQPADPPAELVAPRPVLYLASGALLGLILGVGAALLRNSVDARVKSRQQLEQILGTPLLGTIGRDPKIASSPLVIYGAPHTPLAEAFRQLRTNVQFMDVDRAHKVVLVTSATYEEGRSTTVCNLGLALAEAGTSVCIVDADLRRPALARYLSIDDAIGLTDVLVNRIPLDRALQAVGPSVDLLPSGPMPPNPSELLGSNRMVDLIRKLREAYDVVLVDAPPLLPVTDAAVLAPRVDGVLLLVRQSRTVVPEVQAAKDALHAVSARILGAVLTMAPYAGTGAHARSRKRAGDRKRGWRSYEPSLVVVSTPDGGSPATGAADSPDRPGSKTARPSPTPRPSADPPTAPYLQAPETNGQVLERDAPPPAR